MNDAANGKRVRRRRTWYRRRLRVQRTMVAVVFGTMLAGACWQSASRFFLSSSLGFSQRSPDPSWQRGNVHRNLAMMAARSAKPAKALRRIPDVYPYSVVPGGVKDLDELREAAARDAVVRQHYAHFDYNHAQLVRVAEPREVYLSYRIRDTVFWTRKKVSLHVGELLLTDGKITARGHCGNQVSDVAKPEVSNEEPDEDVLDQPVVAALELPSLPMRPVLSPADLPGGGPSAPRLFMGGFIFPTVSAGVPVASGCSAKDVLEDKRCLPKHRQVVPEPSTWMLMGSGLVFIFSRYRRVASPTRA